MAQCVSACVWRIAPAASLFVAEREKGGGRGGERERQRGHEVCLCSVRLDRADFARQRRRHHITSLVDPPTCTQMLLPVHASEHCRASLLRNRLSVKTVPGNTSSGSSPQGPLHSKQTFPHTSPRLLRPPPRTRARNPLCSTDYTLSMRNVCERVTLC